MKKLIITALIAVSAVTLLNGCIGLSLGGGSKTETQNATVGQQLIDLKRAKDAGAISDSEYQAQRTKLLADQQPPK